MNRFLVIGFGGSGQRTYQLIRQLQPECKIAVWYTGSRMVNLPNDVVRIDDCREALQFQPEGVFIATPTETHIRYAEPFLKKCKFILMDKPLGSSLNPCEIFVRNARQTNTHIYINFQRRFLPCWQWMHEELQREDTGELLYGTVTISSYYPSWRTNKPQEELYVARKDLGGGVLLTECHELDLISWLLGPIESVDMRKVVQDDENGVENQAQMLLDINFPYGQRSISVNLDDFCRENIRSTELHFEKVTYRIDEKNELIEKITAEGRKEALFQKETENPHKLLLKKILSQEENEERCDFLPALQDGIAVNAIIHAANRAFETGRTVHVCPSICPKEGISYLEESIDLLQEAFANRIIAIYGLGSLGYGGYVEGWSDFDIDVIIESEYITAKRDYEIGKQIEQKIKKNGFERIDIRVYDYKHLNARKTVLTYGQCSRATMLCDSAILLAGQDIRSHLLRPTKEEQNREAYDLLSHMLQNPMEWWEKLPWDDIAAHFALVARFLYTRGTGKVAGKQIALEYLIANFPIQFSHKELQWVLWALSCRMKYHPMLIQDCLHNDAICVLRHMFEITREILRKEVED